ncbi:sulfatase-like hydrolase/transferase [Pelagicoccus sp. SDUM812005]|uniref:sulfatase family protein n=1 Tax=Pelagicoccus sp. SDUM812005 TaxID=3041257 RepID=UPI00280C6543|nr:sulfatase-like hydrolase/transferase [Pelagicoccus sp. SDUM812005]MDQ8180253.1 sulfatase-like hydrolase/transferase [Pelagicoccus sp. SDUM812005]
MDTPRLNVLMVLADQHNADLLGCAGHPQARTPHLDAFAQNATRFTRAYCSNPICTPSRVGILSGQYCHNHGYYGLGGPQPQNLPSLFHHFKAHGYRTAAYGKLHLPNDPRNWIADAVDEFGDSYETVDGIHAQSEFLDGLERDGLRHLEDSWHNEDHYGSQRIPLDAMPSDLPYERTQERWCAQKAADFIGQAPDSPFFIQVALQKPHHPLFPQRQFWELYPEDLELPPTIDNPPYGRPKTFQSKWKQLRANGWEFSQPGESWRDGARRSWRGTLACISQVDDVFGRLLQSLEDLGVADNTIVIYGSDHGAYHTMFGIPEKAPGICSDAVCRVPMLWRVPGIEAKNARCDALVENIDYAPTLTDLCGIPPMDTADGESLKPLLTKERKAIHKVAATENVWSRAIVWDRWRLVHYTTQTGVANGCRGELYDLQSDPEETKNLFESPDYREIVSTGQQLLIDWMVETSRCVTTLCIPADGSDIAGRKHFRIAKDGRAPRALQPRERPELNFDYI